MELEHIPVTVLAGIRIDEQAILIKVREPILHDAGARVDPSFDRPIGTYRELAARDVNFEKPPQKLFWGYGAELRDPDGYLIYLWDERTMREKG